MKNKRADGEALKALLGLNIKRFRASSEFTIEELAHQAGISVTFLGAIERGEKWPSPATLTGIAHGLKVCAHDLLRPEEKKSQDITRITTKLIKEIMISVNQATKMINTTSTE